MSDVGQLEREDPGPRHQAVPRAARLRLPGQLGVPRGQLEHRGRAAHAEPAGPRLRRQPDQQGYRPAEEGDASLGGGRDLYEANHDVYGLLRYGVKVKPGIGEQTETVWLIDWTNPRGQRLRGGRGGHGAGQHTKRPDVVLYVNGIALATIELKRSKVAVSEGIRQTIGNQKPEFIRPFFTTVQLVMAGNDVEGLRYARHRHAGEVLAQRGREDRQTIEEPLDRAADAAVLEGAAAGDHPRLHGVRRRRQEDLPSQPVLRRQGCAGAGAASARAASSGTPRAPASP